MKLQKHILSRLMSLDNKQADKQLAGFANGIWAVIKKSKDNDEVFDNLELLEEFIYKVPKTAIKIIRHIIKHPHPTPVRHSKFGDLEGKSYPDLVLKSVSLLSQLRYMEIDAVLEILAKLVNSDIAGVKAKVLETIKHLAQYDWNVLTKSKIGYGVQQKVYDFISKWSKEERLNNFDFIEVVTRELLSSSVEGSGWDKFDTLTMHFGAVQPTEFLKKLRIKVIDLIIELYESTRDSQQKLGLVNVLEEAVRTPSNVAYNDDVAEMITATGQYLIQIYRKLLFDEESKLIGPLGVAEEIDKRLHWQQRHGLLKSSEAIQLRKDILSDRFYKIARLLVGDDIVFREENGWDNSEGKRSDQIQKLVDSISETNIDQWISDVNAIASEKGLINDWHFTPFKYSFLRKLAEQKPEITVRLLDHTFRQHTPLLDFLESFLTGFRIGKHLELWDKYVEKIVIEQNPNLVASIPFSLIPDRESSLVLRQEDIGLVEKIVEQKDKFAFLNKQNEKNYVLRHAIINVLIHQHMDNPEIIEPIIIKEIKLHPEYAATHLQAFSFGTFGHKLNFSNWSKAGIDSLKKMLVETPHLDWSLQGLILELGKADIKILFDIFYGRIEFDQNKKSKRRLPRDYADRYDAIPYDANEDMRNFVVGHPDTRVYLQTWLEKISSKWSAYNWNVGRFIDKIGMPLREIILPLLEKGDDESLLKVIRIITPFDSKDLDLYMEIAGKTDNKIIVDHVGAQFFSTGVVNGKYGIAEAHEKTAEKIEQYKSSTNKRIRKFAEKLSKSLRDGAIAERRRADEEEKLRKIEFEN